MIISQLLTRTIKIVPGNFFPRIFSNNSCINFRTFSTEKETEVITKLLSQQTLKQFTQSIYENTQASLQKGAQLLASLQFQVQKRQQELQHLQQLISSCPPNTKSLIEKLQIVSDNIKKQQQQIQSIQKRAQKQLVDCKSFAVTSIAKQMLDIADSLGKCIKTSAQFHKSQDHEVVKEISKANKQMRAIFQLYGIKQFDPTGQIYDPNKEQALTTTPAPNQKMKNKVAFTMRTGYTIKGRLLRSAHVGIYS